MVDNKLLIANSAIYSILQGQTQLTLIDSNDAAKGFQEQLFSARNVDLQETLAAVLNADKLVAEGGKVTFGKTSYNSPTTSLGSETYNNWLLAVSIQEEILGKISRELYQELKKHVYRIWFNHVPRRTDLTEASLAKKVTSEDGLIKWQLGTLQFELDLHKILPDKIGRVYSINLNTYHLMICDHNTTWLVDLMLHSTGWDALAAKAVQNVVSVSNETLLENTSRVPVWVHCDAIKNTNVQFSLVGE